MFERFNAAGRRNVILAQEEARMLNHPFVGTEHLTLSAFSARGSAAQAILGQENITLTGLHEALRELAPEGSETPLGAIPFTPAARRALEAATSMANEARTPVDPDHILLGILGTAGPEDLSSRLLAAIGLPAGPLSARLRSTAAADDPCSPAATR